MTPEQQPSTVPSTPPSTAPSTVPSTPPSTAPSTVPSTVPSTADEWGAPSRPGSRQRRTWSTRRIVVAAAVAMGIAGAGTATVYAASDSTTTGSTGQAPGGGPGGGPGGMGLLSRALHGEYVVSDGDGGHTTALLQNGEVTAITGTSVTAASDDGYTRTYTIDADTVAGNGSADLSSIEAGDEVTIVATVSGDTATVDSLTEDGTTTGQAPPGQGQDGTDTNQGG